MTAGTFLQDWLVVLLAKWQRAYGAHPDCLLEPGSLPRPLVSVPRWVFALLRGPLLAANTRLSTHRMGADLRTWLLALYSSLPFGDLLTAVHPSLSAYRSAEVCAQRELDLSWAAMRESGCSLFVRFGRALS